MPHELFEGCNGGCIQTWWEMDQPNISPGVTESDEDCPDPDEEEIRTVVEGSIREFNLRQRQDAKSPGCPEHCICALEDARVHWTGEWPVTVRWRKTLTIEGHDHTCRYSARVEVRIRKFKKFGECTPSFEIELPEIEVE